MNNPSDSSCISPSYVAGFFDGEGSICLSFGMRNRSKLKPGTPVCTFNFTISISNTDKRILEILMSVYGGNMSAMKKRPGRKQAWQWRLHSAAPQRAFMESIHPHSIVKSKQISIGLEFLETVNLKGRPPSQEQWDIRRKCHEELWKLNARGDVEKEPKHRVPEKARTRSIKSFMSESDMKKKMDSLREKRKFPRNQHLIGKWRTDNPTKATLYVREWRIRKRAALATNSQ